MRVGGIVTPTEIDGVPVVPKGANTDLDRDAFLKLLITQLANQDPLDPVSNENFIAQQATFSQLEQQLALNEKFDTFLDDQREVFSGIATMFSTVQSSGFLGQEVEFPSDTISVIDGETTQLFFDTNESLDVGYTVLNEFGSVVASKEPTLYHTGQGHSINFEGLGLDSKPLPDGNYQVVLSATNAAGETLQGSGYAIREVAAVDFRSEIPVLRFQNGESIALDQVLSLNKGGDLISG